MKKESNPRSPEQKREDEMIKEAFEILGFKVRDRITGFAGVASSVSFDLYGCIQVVINPGVNKEMKMRESHWFDINRLKITSKERVMPLPKSFQIDFDLFESGPEVKPAKP